jgi:hypothetical protein
MILRRANRPVLQWDSAGCIQGLSAGGRKGPRRVGGSGTVPKRALWKKVAIAENPPCLAGSCHANQTRLESRLLPCNPLKVLGTTLHHVAWKNGRSGPQPLLTRPRTCSADHAAVEHVEESCRAAAFVVVCVMGAGAAAFMARAGCVPSSAEFWLFSRRPRVSSHKEQT